MKNLIILLLFFTIVSCSKKVSQPIFSSDIKNFWEAYDKIVATSDTLIQKQYLEDYFISKGSVGLKDIMTARNYTSDEYLNAIRNYPMFWKSIRANTLKADSYRKEISGSIQKLKNIYPDLKVKPIFLTMGALRTNGTVLNGHVLIGSEMAFGEESTVVHELPAWRQPFFKEFKPLENIALLCTHEYIHTQQKELVHNLLSICLYEGIAEYLSCKATGKPSNTPSVKYGKENVDIVVNKFVKDLYLSGIRNNWIWGQNRNELKVRDLGYFIGYEIAERYVAQAADKTKAVKDLIELYYSNESDVESIVDASGLLPKPLLEIYNEYEKPRPIVTSIDEFENGSKTANPKISKITVQFSAAFNGENAGLDFGPLGSDYYPKVDNSTRKWGPDIKSYSFNVALSPNRRYQMVIEDFMLENGIRLKPFLIDFETGK